MADDLPNLETKLGGLTLSSPIMNAAGTCRTVEEVRELARSQAGAIVVGSMTMEPRPGNQGDTFVVDDHESLNSRGLPDRGADYWQEVLPEMVDIAHDHGKPLVVSGAGFSPEEFGQLAEIAAEGGADAFEANFGCPNAWGNGAQKPIMSFDPDGMRRTFYVLRERVGLHIVIGVKYSPYSNPLGVGCSVDIVCEYDRLIQFIVNCNTFANALRLKPDGTSAITPQPGKRFGYAGLAGPAVKAINLGQAAMWGEALEARQRKIPVIGVGGIETGQDMLDYMYVGASAVQVGTAYLRHKGPNSEGDPSVFGQILAEYVELKQAA